MMRYAVAGLVANGLLILLVAIAAALT